MTYIKGLACHVLISPNGGKRHAGLRVSGGIMDDSALRRQQLLKDTRRMYDSGIPAIHPRYRHIYNDLYDEPSAPAAGSFYLRLAIGILCFVCYVWADYKDMTVAGVNSSMIVNQIEQQTDLEEVMETFGAK